MSNAKQLRAKADEMESQAKKLREAHRNSQSSGSSGGSGDDFIGVVVGIAFWCVVIGWLLNSCS